MIGDASGRFVRMEYGAAQPAKDIVSGEVQDLVDLGVTIQGYGRLYLSPTTIRELAEVAGVLERVDPVLEQKSWYDKGYGDALEHQYDYSLRDVVRDLGVVADRIERGRAGVGTEDTQPIAAVVEQQPDGPIKDVDGAAAGESENSRTDNKPRSGQGRKRVRTPGVDAASSGNDSFRL